MGFKKEYKGRGYASSLIDRCIKDTEDEGLKRVCVVTRKGPFIAGSQIFLKKGFEIVDKAGPDFELLVKKFDENVEDPRFTINLDTLSTKYANGITIIRSVQCPYTLKNVNTIIETTRNEYDITPLVVDIEDAIEAQRSPCAFGTFCIIHDGDIIVHHPISNTRFKNIMNKRFDK